MSRIDKDFASTYLYVYILVCLHLIFFESIIVTDFFSED